MAILVPSINQSFLPTDSFSFLEPNTLGIINKQGIRIGTLGDGSCFFHSICLALNKNDIWHNESYVDSSIEDRKKISLELRNHLSRQIKKEDYEEIISKHFKKNTKEPLTSFEDFKKKLLDSKVWADELIIRWTSKCLNLNIIFLNLMENAMFCNVHHSQIIKSLNCKFDNGCGGPTKTIIVAWVKHQHFELIGIIENTLSNDIRARVVFTHEDAQQIMKKYFSQCSN